jgi:hypothetical protein
MRSNRVATTPTAASSSYADRTRRQWRAVDYVFTCTASSLQRRPRAWLPTRPRQRASPSRATPVEKWCRRSALRRPRDSFGIGAASSTWLNRAVVERARGRATGDAEQLCIADTSEHVERERLPGTQVDILEFRWMYRSPRMPVRNRTKRTENKRNKANPGPMEYCEGPEWPALIQRKGRQ